MTGMFLVIVDAFSKWLGVYATQSATKEVTLEKLKTSFAIHGITESLVSGNGTCFRSSKFRTFCQSQGIIDTKSAPYRPSSNGLAERTVQTLKDRPRKLETGSFNEKLPTILLAYRNTRHATTGSTPAELLLRRRRASDSNSSDQMIVEQFEETGGSKRKPL